MTPVTWLVKNLLTNKQVLVVEKSVDVLEVDSRSLILRVRITLECTLDCYRSLSFKFWTTPYQNVKQKMSFCPKIDDETEIFDLKWAKNEHFCPKMTKNFNYINPALGRRFRHIQRARWDIFGSELRKILKFLIENTNFGNFNVVSQNSNPKWWSH